MRNSEKQIAARGGMGTLGALGVAFIVLKLTEEIDWSWTWVLAPFWVVPVALVLFFVVAVAWVAWMDVRRARARRRAEREETLQ